MEGYQERLADWIMNPPGRAEGKVVMVGAVIGFLFSVVQIPICYFIFYY